MFASQSLNRGVNHLAFFVLGVGGVLLRAAGNDTIDKAVIVENKHHSTRRYLWFVRRPRKNNPKVFYAIAELETLFVTFQ